MRVLVITADFPPVKSGEAGHAFHLAHSLARSGVEVHILTSQIDNACRYGGLTVYPIMTSWSWRDLPKLVSTLKRCRPDVALLVFFGPTYRGHPMITFAPTIARAVRPSLRFVTQFENVDVEPWTHPWLTWGVRKLVARWAGPAEVDIQYGTLLRDSHRLIVLSEMHRARLAEHSECVNEKHVLIPPPPLMKICADGASQRLRTRGSLSIEPDEFALIHYGYIRAGKGLETLIAACSKLVQRSFRIKVLFVGGELDQYCWHDLAGVRRGYVGYLKDLAEAQGVSKKLIWTGPCQTEGEEASAYFSAADACVLPFDTGIHLNNSTFSAAVSHGIPVVATRTTTTERAFQDQENVLLCPPMDPTALADAVTTLIERPSIREHLRQGSLRMAEEWFSWEKATERTIATFREPVANGQQRPARV